MHTQVCGWPTTVHSPAVDRTGSSSHAASPLDFASEEECSGLSAGTIELSSEESCGQPPLAKDPLTVGRSLTGAESKRIVQVGFKIPSGTPRKRGVRYCSISPIRLKASTSHPPQITVCDLATDVTKLSPESAHAPFCRLCNAGASSDPANSRLSLSSQSGSRVTSEVCYEESPSRRWSLRSPLLASAGA